MCLLPRRVTIYAFVRVFPLAPCIRRALFCRTTVSSMSDEMALFSLTGPGAVESLAELQGVACPAAGRSLEWNFEGAKVRLNYVVDSR